MIRTGTTAEADVLFFLEKASKLRPEAPLDELRMYYERIAEAEGVLFLQLENSNKIFGMIVFEKGWETPYVPTGDGAWWNEFTWCDFLAWWDEDAPLQQQQQQQQQASVSSLSSSSPSLSRVSSSSSSRDWGSVLYSEVARRAHVPEVMMALAEGQELESYHRHLGFMRAATVARKKREHWTTQRVEGVSWREARRGQDEELLLEGLVAIYSAPLRKGDWSDPQTRIEEVDAVFSRHADDKSIRILLGPDGEAVGFFCFIPKTRVFPYGVSYWPYHFQYTYLSFLYVKPSARKMGCARQVMHYMETIAREQGVDDLLSTYEAGNELAEKWHLSVGFVPSVRVYHIEARELHEHLPEEFCLNQSGDLVPTDIKTIKT